MQKPFSIMLVVVLVSLLLLVGWPAEKVRAAATLNVPSAAYGTIQAAIDAAVSGDTVQVAAGTYYERITLKDGVQVLGAGAAVTILDGSHGGTVVTAVNVGSGSKLDGFTLTHGHGSYGGGMSNYQSSLTISNCVFSNNYASQRAGGMDNDHNSSPLVNNCTFSNNSGNGGAMGNYDGSAPLVTNCVFSNNSSWSSGAGMVNLDTAPTLINCIFYHNTASSLGGAMYNTGAGSTPVVTNCTMYANSAQFGGALANASSPTTLTNCILWGDGGGEIWYIMTAPVLTYCDIQQAGYAGTDNNINIDPLFVTPAAGNLHLQAGSPCIDVGSNSAPSLPTLDFHGGLRTKYGGQFGSSLSPITDMGVYEFGVADLAITKTGSPDPVIAGTDLSYTLSVTNYGPEEATLIAVSEAIPAGTTYSSDNASQGTYAAGVWDVGNLASGFSADLTLVVRVNSGTTDNLSNTAAVSGYVADANQTNDSAADNTTVITHTDLMIDKTGAASVLSGNHFSYTLSVTNNGPSDATGINVTDILPAAAVYFDSTPGQGTFNPDTGLWTVGGLTSGATASLNIEVTASALPQTVITNTALVTGNETDPLAGNNRDSLNTRVVSAVGGEVTGLNEIWIAGFRLFAGLVIAAGGTFLVFKRFKP